MNQSHIRQILNDHPRLRAILSPAIVARRYLLAKQRSYKEPVYRRLVEILVEDPVIYANEFRGSFALDVRSDLFARQLLDESYEQSLAQWCHRFLDPGRDVIDVGANVGFYSVLFAKLIQEERKVLSLEPTKNALDRLYGNLKRNGVENKVIVYEGVASNYNGSTDIYFIEGKEEYSSIRKLRHPSVAGMTCKTIKVKCSTVDELMTKYSLNPGFMKIDVEGAEHEVIEGCRQVLARHRPAILSEVSDSLLKENGSSAKEVINLIRQHDYIVIHPIFPTSLPGSRALGDIVCLPKEIASSDNLMNSEALVGQ